MFHDKAMLGADYSASLAPMDALQAVSLACPSHVAIFDTDVAAVPGQGTFFDEHVDFNEPEGAEFTARILAIYDEAKPKERAWKAIDLANHTIRIRKILANGMRVHFHRKLPSVLYFRGANSKHYRDKAGWMRHGALGDVVNVLADAGLVQTITGGLAPNGSEKPSWASSYAPTDKLIAIAVECGVSVKSADLHYDPSELVRLFAPKATPFFDWTTGRLSQRAKGRPIKFEPTPETQEWTATLEAINAFYRQQDIGLGLSPDDLAHWLAVRNDDPDRKGAPYRLPELFKTDIYRVFNNGDAANPTFDKGGRLFGGWWMSTAEDLRKAIIINGQPTVEIDYAECHPRMLYHRAGLDGQGELYTLPEIAAYEVATGVKPDTYRPYIKWLMQVLINCRGRPYFVDKPERLIMPPDFTVKQIVGFIEARHQPIKEVFKTGAGLDLMRIESEIALEIVSAAMAEGWTVLSIHDSFVTSIDRLDRLKAMMIDAYVQRLGREPSFK